MTLAICLAPVFCYVNQCKQFRVYYNAFLIEPREVTLKVSQNKFSGCLKNCSRSLDCNSVSWSKSQEICKVHSVSPYDMDFNGNINKSSDWNLYVKNEGVSWKPIAKFSSSNGQFQGDSSFKLWSHFWDSMNNDSCVREKLNVRCNRHYVHKERDWILNLREAKKIKISLYEDGIEAAWVVFDKQPGSSDNWFQPSRVIDSYPWDTKLLKSSEMSMESFRKSSFYIVKPNPAFYLKYPSPHAYWMKIYETVSVNICVYGNTNSPQILYSKGPSLTLLSKSLVSRVNPTFPNSHWRYNLEWSEAENFCETNLHVHIATHDEVNQCRITQGYECCRWGWMTGGVASFPMNRKHPNCGNIIGMMPAQTSGSFDIYCKPDQNLVGLADTMVISVEI